MGPPSLLPKTLTKVGRFTVWVIVALAAIITGYLTLYLAHL